MDKLKVWNNLFNAGTSNWKYFNVSMDPSLPRFKMLFEEVSPERGSRWRFNWLRILLRPRGLKVQHINSLLISAPLNFFLNQNALTLSKEMVNLNAVGRILLSPPEDASPRQLRQKRVMRSNSAGPPDMRHLPRAGADLGGKHFSGSLFYRSSLTLPRPTKPQDGIKLVLNPIAQMITSNTRWAPFPRSMIHN